MQESPYRDQAHTTRISSSSSDGTFPVANQTGKSIWVSLSAATSTACRDHGDPMTSGGSRISNRTSSGSNPATSPGDAFSNKSNRIRFARMGNRMKSESTSVTKKKGGLQRDSCSPRYLTEEERNYLLQDIAKSRQALHESLLNMKVGSQEWKEIQQKMRASNTFTNEGATLALECHIVDNCSFKQNQRIKHKEEHRHKNKTHNHSKQTSSTNTIKTRKKNNDKSSSPDLELRGHLIGRESLRCLQTASAEQCAVAARARAFQQQFRANNPRRPRQAAMAAFSGLSSRLHGILGQLTSNSSAVTRNDNLGHNRSGTESNVTAAISRRCTYSAQTQPPSSPPALSSVPVPASAAHGLRRSGSCPAGSMKDLYEDFPNHCSINNNNTAGLVLLTPEEQKMSPRDKAAGHAMIIATRGGGDSALQKKASTATDLATPSEKIMDKETSVMMNASSNDLVEHDLDFDFGEDHLLDDGTWNQASKMVPEEEESVGVSSLSCWDSEKIHHYPTRTTMRQQRMPMFEVIPEF
jgi:hypothetical protein